MSYPPNHKFSRPAGLHEDEQFKEARLFSIDRRHNALNVNPGANNNFVRTVNDEPLSDWQQVWESAATTILPGVPGVPGATLSGAYVRSAMRGQGRDRWR